MKASGAIAPPVPLPRKVQVQHVGGGILDASRAASDKETLWAELFKEKERALLRASLENGEVSFGLHNETYQVHIRMLRIVPPVPEARDLMQGPVVVLLHDLEGGLTDSWAWSKLVWPLHQANMSVVAIDLPGCGRSSVSGSVDAAYSKWKHQDWKVVLKVMDRMRISKAHFVAVGEGCNIVLRLMDKTTDRFERTHFFHNPVLDIDYVLPIKLPPGCTQAQKEWLVRDQSKRFGRLMDRLNLQIWATYDKAGLPRSSSTLKFIADFEDRIDPVSHFTLTPLTEQHMCEAGAGSQVDAGIRILFPCRWLKATCVRFLRADPSLRLPRSEMPTPSSSARGSATPSATSASTSALPPGATEASAQALVQWAASGSLSAAMLGPGQIRRSLPRTTLRNGRVDTARIPASFSVAVQRRPQDPMPERERVLMNAPAVTRLKNCTEMRGPAELDQELTAQEREWIEDALDSSMMTLGQDERRRGGDRRRHNRWDQALVPDQPRASSLTLMFNRTRTTGATARRAAV